MLRSSNPILSKRDAFTPAAPQGYGQQPSQRGFGEPQGYAQPQGYGQPQQGFEGYPAQPPGGPVDTGDRMTFDDVVTKSAITIGLLIASAAVAWNVIPDTLMFPALIGSGLIGLVTVLLVSFRRHVSPPLVLGYAVIEGVFIGMISKYFEYLYDGIVAQAVLGTFVAAGMTLAAYKFFNIRVTAKFRKVLFIATASFAVVCLLNFGLSLAGINLGLRDGGTGPVSLLAVGFSLLGCVLAVLNLVLDFDYIERGIQMGAPAKESWRGAFGLTVTMVWLYVEILRILSYLRR